MNACWWVGSFGREGVVFIGCAVGREVGVSVWRLESEKHGYHPLIGRACTPLPRSFASFSSLHACVQTNEGCVCGVEGVVGKLSEVG
jgi:hypothetical protein